MKLITTNECAALLGVSRRTLYRWIANNTIPYRVVGSLYKFDKEEVIEWTKK